VRQHNLFIGLRVELLVVLMEDSYIWMENLQDDRVLKVVEEENKRFREFVGKLSEELFPEVWELYSIPTLHMARLTDSGIIAMFKESERQVIRWLDGEIIIDSKALEEEVNDQVLLQGFTSDESGKRLAYSFSIGGADEGITRILNLESGELIDELRPSVWNITFLENGYYFSRFYRHGKTPDGIKAPAVRLFWKDEKGEKIVFGEGLGSGYFLDLKKSTDGKWAMLTVTFGWNRSEIYLGPIESPDLWEKVYSADVPAEPIDVVNGRLYVLTREGKGLGKIVAIEGEKPIEVIPKGEFPLEWAVILSNKILAGRSSMRAIDLRFIHLMVRSSVGSPSTFLEAFTP
jgi:prolyl oligopeptidase